MMRLALLLLGLIVCCAAVELECSPERQADIFLLLDASGSVGQWNFDRVLRFVESIIDAFTIGPDNVRVGMATFAKYVDNKIWLDQYMNKTDLLEAVHAIHYTKGNTQTHQALKLARTEAFSDQNGGRDSVPNFLVVLTDGQSSHPKLTEAEAHLLGQENITVLAIGVGNNFNRDELELIATAPSLVYGVKSFRALNSIKDQMVTNICEGPTDGQWSEWSEWGECSTTCGGGVQIRERTCTNPSPAHGGEECEGSSNETLSCNPDPCPGPCQADIFLLLDSSGSVGVKNFQRVLGFVKSLVDSFPIGSDKVRMGMDTFAGRVGNKIRLDQYMDKPDLLKAVEALRYTRGRTNTHQALKLARNGVFSEQDGGRDAVPNYLVVLTDGHSTHPQQTEAEAHLLTKEDITVLTIGVGGHFNKKELELIASSPSLMLDVKGFHDLHSIKDDLMTNICGDHSF